MHAPPDTLSTETRTPAAEVLPFPAQEAVLSPVPGLRRRYGLAASLLVHLCLLGALCALGQSLEPPKLVYEVSLTGLPLAGSMPGGAPASSAGEVEPSTVSLSSAPPSAVTAPSASAAPPAAAAAPATVAQPPKTAAPPKTRPTARSAGTQRAASPASSATAATSPPSLAPRASLAESTGARAHGDAQGKARGSAQTDTSGAAVAAGGQGGEGSVFAVHEVDSMPAIVRRATPVYPSEAKKRRVEGRVVVRLVVDASGKATQCTVHGAEPQGYFEASALEAAGRMRFAPGKKAGRAVSTLVLLPFDFRLR